MKKREGAGDNKSTLSRTNDNKNNLQRRWTGIRYSMLNRIPSEASHEEIPSLFQLPHLWAVKGVRREAEATAAKYFHHQEGNCMLTISLCRKRRQENSRMISTSGARGCGVNSR